MKRLLLSLMVLQGVGELHTELTNKQKAAVVVGAGVATGSCLWFWNREPNSTKIIRAYNLYRECRSCLDKQHCYTSGDPEQALKQLRSCVLIQRADEIISSCKDVKGRYGCFWNKSDELLEAVNMMKRLERNVREYQQVEQQLQQQVAIRQINQLWLQLSEFLINSDDYRVIYSTTLNQLLSHPIVVQQDMIKKLHCEMDGYKRGRCALASTFEDAFYKILALNKSMLRLQNIIFEIELYEGCTEKYKCMLALDIDNFLDKQHIIMDARDLGQGVYPLMNFVNKLRDDIRSLKNLSLQFEYVKNSWLPVKGLGQNAKLSVVYKLEQIINFIITDSAYRDEQRRQEEQRMHEERMKLEQERLRIEQARVDAERACARAEIEKADAARARARTEDKKLQAELDRAYANGGRSSTGNTTNSLQAELDRTYEAGGFDPWG